MILEVVDTLEEANELETKYIKHYKSVWGEYCVNILEAGWSGPQPKKYTEEELR